MNDTHRQRLTKLEHASVTNVQTKSSFTPSHSQHEFSIFPHDVFQCITTQMWSEGVNTWEQALFRIRSSSLTYCIYCKWGDTLECKVLCKKKEAQNCQSATGSAACELLFFSWGVSIIDTDPFMYRLKLKKIYRIWLVNQLQFSSCIYTITDVNKPFTAGIIMNLHLVVSPCWSVYHNTCNSTGYL